MVPLKNESIKGPLKRHKQFHEHVKYDRLPTIVYLYPAIFEKDTAPIRIQSKERAFIIFE